MTTTTDKPTDRAAALRTWLMKAPRPVKLQVYGTDGTERDVVLRQGAPWSEIAISVAALLPERVEALSSEGHVLRACIVSDLVAKEEKAEAVKQSTFLAMNATDPETQRLIVFAELLQRTAVIAIEAVQANQAVLLDRLASLAESAERRADTQAESALQLSVAIRNLMLEHAQETIERATEKEESPLEQMASNFLSGKAAAEAEAGGAQAPAKSKPNGKAKNHGN